jgi:hypothetical protein
MFLSEVNVPAGTVTLSSKNSSPSINGKVFKVEDFDLLQKLKNQFESDRIDCTEIDMDEFDFVMKPKKKAQKTELEIISELPEPKSGHAWVRIESTATYEEEEVWLIEVPEIYQEFGQLDNLKWECSEKTDEGQGVLASKDCYAGCEDRRFKNEFITVKE